jgi:hypothetical protein
VAGALGLLSAIVLITLLPNDAEHDEAPDAPVVAEPTSHPMTRAFWTVPIIILFTMILVSSLWAAGLRKHLQYLRQRGLQLQPE